MTVPAQVAMQVAVTAIEGVKRAFGAPGDHGYETREGLALFELYSAYALLRTALEAAADEDR